MIKTFDLFAGIGGFRLGIENIFRKKNIIKLSANESALGQSPKSRKIISSIKKAG